jgi:hypothetical protein
LIELEEGNIKEYDIKGLMEKLNLLIEKYGYYSTSYK